jgi:hypothetical protein
MRVILCRDPLTPGKPDAEYETEAAAAEGLGLVCSLIDYEALVHEQDVRKAVRRVTLETETTLAIYRGWMLRPGQYQDLYGALAALGLRLINDPAAYQHAHYLPEWYPLLERYTPRSVWLHTGPDVEIAAIMEILRPLGDAPVVLKDFVKSQKHYWNEACFIPSASDRAGVERVVRRFLQLQGEDLAEGLVFREFVEFEPLAQHSRSGMPLTREYRIFVLDGEPIYWTEYWEEGDYGDAAPPMDFFREAARLVGSRFFTMDVAKRRDGEWMIVELGDAQVAGLPENADVGAFYAAVRHGLP